ncbi:MAG: hypothetical protein KGJ84_12220 [Elusimicrobia bacterium]|nr:hypothetical protein [Elusimicrobiota bacterium]
MARLKIAGKIVTLILLSFLAALIVGRTPIPQSYALAVLVSVIACPLLLGITGARLLQLGPVPTMVGINLIPVLSALDDLFRLGDPVQLRWLVASILFAWAGWRLGRGASATVGATWVCT